MKENLQIAARFYNVNTQEQALIKEIVDKNIEGKLDSYLQQIFAKKPDAYVRLDYKVSQNKHNKYEAKFNFWYDGKVFPYSEHKGFKYVEDLVNHAFTHFKETLSKQH